MALADNILQFPDAGGGRYRYDPDTGVAEIEQEDGGVIVDFAPNMAELSGMQEPSRNHGENLAEFISPDVLSSIAGELLQAIEQDDGTRADWLQQRAKGIDLLGLKVEENRAATGSVPLDGMSAVKHPLLLEACLTFHANAVGELLPASGPVKVANTGADGIEDDELARELERDLNTFLTTTATEYYPDTDKLIFQVGWSGAGFKKGFHCPLRRRPVIESVDAKDLIVSNDATDLGSASRVTHVISMNTSTFKRMQIAGAYLKRIEVQTPEQKIDPVDRKVAGIQGLNVSSQRPEDTNRTIYECYCDWDLPGYEHRVDGEESGLPLPYKITIDQSSRQVLEIRRNWREDDADQKKRRVFILYPFVPMFGFYPFGLLHFLGNTTKAITTAWRVLLDAGMFGNFPGFLYLRNGARQQNNNFTVAPGQGAAVDAGGSQDIRSSIMPLPYKEPGPATMSLTSDIADAGRRVAGTMEIKVGEGNQQAPVGTTLALIEQATMIMSAVHKRLHTAQSHEFAMLKELLSEDPEALWRHRKDAVSQERKATLMRALQDRDLAPQADPNTPSNMHRLMKAMAVKQLQAATPEIYDPRAIDAYCLRQIGVDKPDQFFIPPQPPQQAVDPVQAMTQVEMEKVKVSDKKIEATSRDKALDRQSREEIEKMKLMERLAKL